MNNQTPDITGLVQRIFDLGLGNLAQDVGDALQTAHTTGYEQGLRDAAEKLRAHAASLAGPNILQDATNHAMTSATLDSAAIVESLIPKESDHG